MRYCSGRRRAPWQVPLPKWPPRGRQRLVELDQYMAALQAVMPPFLDSLAVSAARAAGAAGAVGATGAAEDTWTKRKATTEGTGQLVSAKKPKAAPGRPAVVDLQTIATQQK